MSAGALPIIRVQNLEKVYPGNVHAVRGVSFEVRPKQVVAIIGSSGSGKSTVLRCINRLIEPTEGEIYLEEVKINDQKTDINKIRSEIGMVFQSFELFFVLDFNFFFATNITHFNFGFHFFFTTFECAACF